MVETPFALFHEEVEVGFWGFALSRETAFRLVPDGLDPVDVVPVDRKKPLRRVMVRSHRFGEFDE